jgi:hypothetical protein
MSSQSDGTLARLREGRNGSRSGPVGRFPIPAPPQVSVHRPSKRLGELGATARIDPLRGRGCSIADAS